jgi:hypothetical protein
MRVQQVSNMHTGKAARLDSFVNQRASNDCEIAATATVTGNTYEKIADAFGIQLDPKTGQPDAKSLDRGIDPLNTIFPLLRLGWAASPLLSREHPKVIGTDSERGRPSSSEIKTTLAGRKAVLGYTDEDVGEHALAWDGQTAIDCSNGEIVTLDDVTINVALILVSASVSKNSS